MNKKQKCLLAVALIFVIVIILLNFSIKKTTSYTGIVDYVTQKINDTAVVGTNNDDVTIASNDISAITKTNNADNFTVQFYAYIDSVVTENTGNYVDLNVIETHTDSGVELPTNNGSSSENYNLSTIELKQIDDTEDQYEIVFEKVLTQIYLDENYNYVSNIDIDSINKLKDSNSYILKEIWVLNENGDPESINSEDWTVIEYSENMTFTNSEEHKNDENTIYIDSEGTLRLVYETVSKQEQVIDANFYDYNITDGNVYSSNSLTSKPWESGTQYYYTYKSGINSAENYSGSGTMLAFGNNNAGSGLGSLIWKDANNVSNSLNTHNSSSYKGVTFGLVDSLDENGNIIYSDGVSAPNLFDDGDAIGKKTFSNVKLSFSQNGDSYTLVSASSESNNIDISGLDTFTGMSEYADGSSFGKTIYSNNFWPLDDVEDYEGKDPLMGNYNEYLNGTMKYFGKETSNLPLSDDSENHNYYYGMHLSLEFTITEDYIGPLEYLFYGDDDVWVFLDGELIVDIGGVHTSIGEHANLWDYIDKGTENTHTLDIYYMERGGSGSTCYMYFTLPSVSSATTSSETGNLKILKTVEDDNISEDTEFDFKLSLTYEESELIDIYNYSIYNTNGVLKKTGTISNDGTFSLKAGEYIIIKNLPIGTKCEVEELSTGYITSYKVNESEEVSGLCSEVTVTSENELVTIEYINESKTTDITVTKTWVDNDNEGLTRPSSVTINLLQDNKVIQTKEITAEDEWKYTFENLEKYDSGDGHTYEYTVTENEVINYKTEIDGYDITNIYVGSDAKITNEITKVANIEAIEVENQAITYNISYDVTIDNYVGKATVTIIDYLPYEIDVDLSKLDGGTYNSENKTISWEEEVTVTAGGYSNIFKKEITVVYKGQDVNSAIENTAKGTVVTYYPETHPKTPGEPRITVEDEDTEIVEYVISVEVRKVWDDNDNLKEHRPESVTISLYANNETAYDYDGEIVESIILTEENEWKHIFENLPKYDENGEKIEYTVEESETVGGDLEYYKTAEITYGEEYVEVKNSYKTKDTDLSSEIAKTATEKITASTDEVTYTISYNATIKEYIGEATLTVVDTLSYGIDEEKSDLAGGVYDSNAHTITWEVDLEHINTDENRDYEITFEKAITVVYGENLDATATSVVNNVDAKVYLLETDETDKTEAEATTEIQIPAKVIVKYVELDTGEELIDGYEIDGKPGDEYGTTKETIDGYTYAKNSNNTEGKMTEETIEVIYYYTKIEAKVHVTYIDIDTGEEITDDETIDGYVNDEYKTEQKDIEYYKFVESTDNTKGKMTEETIEVIYYYTKTEAKVHVTYIDIDTGEEITDDETIDGYVNDEYKTEQKDIEYYKFVESTDNTKGKMTEDTIEVIYYYKKMTFNFSVDKTISSVKQNGSTTTYYDNASAKIEVGRKEVDSTSITVTYKIVVTNTEEIAGTGTVIDYIPEYFTVSSSNPSYWTTDDNGNLRTTVSLGAGESTELTVILDWVQGESNFGTTTNTAQVVNLENDANYSETTTADNESSAKLIVSVRTGWDTVNEVSPYVILALCGVTLIIMGVKRNKNAKMES